MGIWDSHPSAIPMDSEAIPTHIQQLQLPSPALPVRKLGFPQPFHWKSRPGSLPALPAHATVIPNAPAADPEAGFAGILARNNQPTLGVPPSHKEGLEFATAPRFDWNPGFNKEQKAPSLALLKKDHGTILEFPGILRRSDRCLSSQNAPLCRQHGCWDVSEEQGNSSRIREELLHLHPSSLR